MILNIGNGLPTCRLITGVDMFIDCFVPGQGQGSVRAICTNCRRAATKGREREKETGNRSEREIEEATTVTVCMSAMCVGFQLNN